MKPKNIFIVIFLLISTSLWATHERAGEITYEHITGSTYKVTITTFTYSLSPADRDSLEIKWGDNTSEMLGRTLLVPLPNDMQHNEYTGYHTYLGMGTYVLSMEDANRNQGVVNIPQSVNIPFYIESTLVISPLGPNNSVSLNNFPIDNGCVNKLFMHNPGASDPDGDSIAYHLTFCKGVDGSAIPEFEQPQTSNSFGIDTYSGDLIWDAPVVQGDYNVAFVIEEYRNGILVGSVTRDMQINIGSCNNEPPIIETLSDTCIIAGNSLEFQVKAYDNDEVDGVVLTAYGSLFDLSNNPAVATPNPAGGYDDVFMDFSWNTNCSHIRPNPYNVYFKAIDNSNPVPLASYHTTNITVIAPPLNLISATPLGTSISIDWTPAPCQNAIGYRVYRKSDISNYIPDYCETGVPAWTGFELIKQIDDKDVLSFTDDNNGEGLAHGNEYCYIVTSYFGNGAESIASNIICALLKKDMPIITNISVENTDDNNGEIYVAWSKPTEIDFNQIPGPFEYRLYGRMEDDPDFIHLITYDNLDDTTFQHININTHKKWIYKIEFFNMEEGNVFKVGETPKISSTFLDIYETNLRLELSWNEDQPWNDDSTHIFRQNKVTGDFDSLVSVYNTSYYTDSNLINGEEYCYFVKTFGHYSLNGLISPIINFSQIKCGVPVDNVPPCTPDLTISTDCRNYKNNLQILFPVECEEDKLLFYIYYKPSIANDNISILDSISDFAYTFETDPPSIVGCFAVSARDSLYNFSERSDFLCIDIDACETIAFPPVITPNGDDKNDFFYGHYVNSVISLDMTVIDRWGDVVFETNDPYFRWDGKTQPSGQLCTTGTYFYVAIVTENTLNGDVKRVLKGSLTVLY